MSKKAENCIDHLNFTGRKCEDCGLTVSRFGNTEDQFDYCCFPDCGCDGARQCMATSGASVTSLALNIEKHRYAFEGYEVPDRIRRSGRYGK